MISLKQLEYFLLVAQSKQISKAAAQVDVSQSTITMALKNLEATLNVKLFKRLKQGIELTQEGNILLQKAKSVLYSVEEIMNINNHENLKFKGTIKLAISYSVSGYFLPGYYAHFAKSFPNIKIQLVEAERLEIEEGLINGNYDVGLFNVANIDNKAELTYEIMVSSKRRLWINEKHKFRQLHSVSLREVAKEPYIMITVDEASQIAHRYWSETTYNPNVIFRTNSIEAVRSMVANGSGVAILADMVYRDWSLEGNKILTVDINEKVPSLDVGLVWSVNKELTTEIKCFYKFMHNAITAMYFPKNIKV